MISLARLIVRTFDLRVTGKWFVLSGLIGVVAGFGAIVFQTLGQVIARYTLSEFAGFSPAEAAGEHVLFEHAATAFSPVWLIVVLTTGGLISGLLVYTFAPEAEGHGTDAAIDAFHHRRGFIRARIPLIKTIASAITLGTGGSGGREGPIAQIGAGFGSFLATRLNLSAHDRRIMLAAGMGAGVGAIFRAPLAGALFAGEILYREAEIESEVIVPAAMSSIVGYSVYCLSLPPETRFLFGQAIPAPAGSALELVPLALLAIVLVAVGVLYIKTFYGVHKLFKKLPGPPHVKPALGAALAGILGLALLHLTGGDFRVLAVLSTGYGAVQEALNPATTIGVGLLLTIAFGKILTTSLTISSGGSGGVFGPSMVIGGCVGTATGQLLHQVMPAIVSHPATYGIVGMAGFFAGCAHAPFSTIIMVSEMTGNYNLLLPTMWVSTLCFLLSRPWTLYTKQVPTRLESPAHRGDFIVDLLEGIRVDEVFRPNPQLQTIPERMSLEDIVHLLATTQQHYFPVVNDAGEMVGIFSSDDVRSWLYDETIWKLAVAEDIMVTNIVSVSPQDDLNTALRRFTALNLDELPVLDPENPGRLLGMLRRKETIGIYNRRLLEHKQAAGDQAV